MLQGDGVPWFLLLFQFLMGPVAPASLRRGMPRGQNDGKRSPVFRRCQGAVILRDRLASSAFTHSSCAFARGNIPSNLPATLQPAKPAATTPALPFPTVLIRTVA